jgi:hypothetical protein
VDVTFDYITSSIEVLKWEKLGYTKSKICKITLEDRSINGFAKVAKDYVNNPSLNGGA